MQARHDEHADRTDTAPSVEASAASAAPPEEKARRYRVPRKRWVQMALFGGLCIIVALIFVVPYLANLDTAVTQ